MANHKNPHRCFAVAGILLLAGVVSAQADPARSRSGTRSSSAVQPRQEALRRYTDWRGWYVGFNAGHGWGKSTLSHTPTGGWVGNSAQPILAANGSTTIEPRDFVGGFQIGYNSTWRNLLVGWEADIHYMNLETQSSYMAPTGTASTGVYTQSVQLQGLATLRLRLGWTFERILLYGTGGLAAGQVKVEQNVHFNGTNSDAFGSKSELELGWAVGGGIEYIFEGNWTIKGEYLYVDLGRATASLYNPTFPGFTHEARFSNSLSIARIGVNYKF